MVQLRRVTTTSFFSNYHTKTSVRIFTINTGTKCEGSLFLAVSLHAVFSLEGIYYISGLRNVY